MRTAFRKAGTDGIPAGFRIVSARESLELPRDALRVCVYALGQLAHVQLIGGRSLTMAHPALVL